MKKKNTQPAAQANVQSTSQQQAIGPSVFDKYAQWIALGLIAFVGFLVYKDYLLFNKMFLFKDIGSDTLNGLYPPMYHTAKYFHEYGFPAWSFNYGMGVNILPLCLRDPFDIFLYMAGPEKLAYLIPYKEYLKLILGGMMFFYYLRMVVKDAFTCIVGSLLFSFSGFMIVGSCWYLFSYEAFNVALLLLGFEKLYQQNKGYVFAIAMAIIAIAMPFNLYVYGFFLLIYALMRMLEDKQPILSKSTLVLGGKLAGLSVLALLMSAVFFIPNVVQLLESPRGSGATSYTDVLAAKGMFDTEDKLHYKTFFSRLFSNDLMGTGINFKGWQNYLEAPLVYCGILSLVLIPQLIHIKDKRKRLVYFAFLAFWFLPVIFPYFRYAFWLFTGDYYRAYSCFVALAILYVGLQVLRDLNSTARKVNLIMLGVACLIFLMLIASNTADEMKGKLVFKVAILAVLVHSAGIYLLSDPKFRATGRYIILGMLVIELGYMSYLPVNDRKVVTAQEMKQPVGYNDTSVQAVAFLKQHDNTFFRIDKNYYSSPAMHGSLNDGLVQDYYGTSSYHSFNQMNYINFLKETGVINPGNELETRWASGLAPRPLLEDICSVKYALYKTSDAGWRVMYDSLAQFGDVKVLKNRYALPFGFTYNTYMDPDQYQKTGKNYRDIVLLQSFFTDPADLPAVSGLKKFAGLDTSAGYTLDRLAADVKIRKEDTLKISSFEPSRITGSVRAKEKSLLFLSIPFDKSWHATLDSKPCELIKVDGGMTGLVMDKGEHQVELTFTSRYSGLSKAVSVVAVLVFGGLVFWGRRKSKDQPA